MEPRLCETEGDAVGTPFSQLPDDDLKHIAAGQITPLPVDGDSPGDLDFARRYAAALLAERRL